MAKEEALMTGTGDQAWAYFHKRLKLAIKEASYENLCKKVRAQIFEKERKQAQSDKFRIFANFRGIKRKLMNKSHF